MVKASLKGRRLKKGVSELEKRKFKEDLREAEQAAKTQYATALKIIEKVRTGSLKVSQLPGYTCSDIPQASAPPAYQEEDEAILRLGGGTDSEGEEAPDDQPKPQRKRAREEESPKGSPVKQTAPEAAPTGPTQLETSPSLQKPTGMGAREAAVAFHSINRLEGLIRDVGLVSGGSRLTKTDVQTLLTEVAVARAAICEMSVMLIRVGEDRARSGELVPTPAVRSFTPTPAKSILRTDVTTKAPKTTTKPRVSFAEATKAKVVPRVEREREEVRDPVPDWQTATRKRKTKKTKQIESKKTTGRTETNRTGITRPVREPRPNRATKPNLGNVVEISPLKNSGIESLGHLRLQILKELKPCLKGVEVINMRAKLKGITFGLECSSPEERDKVVNCPRLADLGLEAKIPSIPGETITILGVEKAMTPGELLEELWEKNLSKKGFNRATDEHRVIPRFSIPCNWIRGGEFVRWVVELPSVMKNALLEEGSVRIEWSLLAVKNHTWITRCFNCLRVGHTKKDCKEEAAVCGHCSEPGHIRKDCPRKEQLPVCLPCKNKGRPHDHSIRDPGCTEYMRALRRR